MEFLKNLKQAQRHVNFLFLSKSELTAKSQKGNDIMKREQLEKLAEKLGKQLSETSGMEQAERNLPGGESGAKWRVHEPGWSGGNFFVTLADVEDHLSFQLQSFEQHEDQPITDGIDW